MHPTLNIAVKAARRAGGIINRASRDVEQIKVSAKRDKDFVTEVDKAAEEAIIGVLKEAYPDHAILAEESGASGDSEHVWIIDPLDGTTNFIHGFPQYAVSIAQAHKGVLQHAVVYDPNRNELFTASKGAGAFLNDKRIRVSKRTKLDEIPQLWNILRGDMSLVGPRPERPVFVEELSREIPMYKRRLKVRPGITGWAQVKHKYDESIEDVRKKVQYDLFYIENMSLRMDFKIILSTFSHMLMWKGH